MHKVSFCPTGFNSEIVWESFHHWKEWIINLFWVVQDLADISKGLGTIEHQWNWKLKALVLFLVFSMSQWNMLTLRKCRCRLWDRCRLTRYLSLILSYSSLIFEPLISCNTMKRQYDYSLNINIPLRALQRPELLTAVQLLALIFMSPPFRVGRHIVFPRVSVYLSICLSACHKSCPLYNCKTA